MLFRSVAEIVGDKLLYTTGVLASRYRSASVILGMAMAFMCKMAVAVAIGAAISQLPRWLVATVTGASFVGVAFTVWRKPDVRRPKAKDSTVFTGAMVAFAGAVPVVRAGSMHDAVCAASDAAQPGDVVLLSPACASFDWYEGYAARGDDFAREVRRMIGASE